MARTIMKIRDPRISPNRIEVQYSLHNEDDNEILGSWVVNYGQTDISRCTPELALFSFLAEMLPELVGRLDLESIESESSISTESWIFLSRFVADLGLGSDRLTFNVLEDRCPEFGTSGTSTLVGGGFLGLSTSIIDKCILADFFQLGFQEGDLLIAEALPRDELSSPEGVSSLIREFHIDTDNELKMVGRVGDLGYARLLFSAIPMIANRNIQTLILNFPVMTPWTVDDAICNPDVVCRSQNFISGLENFLRIAAQIPIQIVNVGARLNALSSLLWLETNSSKILTLPMQHILAYSDVCRDWLILNKLFDGVCGDELDLGKELERSDLLKRCRSAVVILDSGHLKTESQLEDIFVLMQVSKYLRIRIEGRFDVTADFGSYLIQLAEEFSRFSNASVQFRVPSGIEAPLRGIDSLVDAILEENLSESRLLAREFHASSEWNLSAIKPPSSPWPLSVIRY